MDKKDLRARKLQRTFLETAKEIIEEEGVKNLSARKIGDRAGYSYATLYNYFPSMDVLLSHCALDYLDDCYRYLSREEILRKAEDLPPEERLLAYVLEYFRFFRDHPHAFDLAFMEDIDLEAIAVGNDESLLLIAQFWLDHLMEIPAIQEDRELLPVMYEMLGSSLHGKLLYYFKRAGQDEKVKVEANIEREVRFLLERI